MGVVACIVFIRVDKELEILNGLDKVRDLDKIIATD